MGTVQQTIDQHNSAALSVATYDMGEVPLTVGSGVVIRGQGAGSVLDFRQVPNTYEGCLINKHNGFQAPGDTNILIENLTIVCPGNGEPLGKTPHHELLHAMVFRKVRGLKLQNVTIANAAGFGMFNVGCEMVSLQSCRVEDAGRDGIHFVGLMHEGRPDPFDRRQTRTVEVLDCDVVNAGDDGVAVHSGAISGTNWASVPPSGISIRDNRIGFQKPHEVAQGRGIILTGCHNAEIADNLIEGTVGAGLLLQEDHHKQVPPDERLKCENVRVVRNRFRRAGSVESELNKPKHVMMAEGVDHCQILDNSAEDYDDKWSYFRADGIGDTEYNVGTTPAGMWARTDVRR